MKAIILAAGYGRRMRPLSDHTHKALLKIGKDTILDRIVASLLHHELTDIVVVTGYRDESIREHLHAEFPDVDFTFIHNEDYASTNNIYSLALAFENTTIDSDVLLIECDLILDPSVIQKIIDTDRPNVALVDHYRHGMDGTVVTVDDEVITSVIPPHLQSKDFDFSDKFKTLNIYRFSQEFAEKTFRRLLVHYARAIDNNCYYELILGILIYMQREVIHALVIDQEDCWAEVDDPNDLRTAAFVFEKDRQLESLQESFGGFWNYDVVDFAFIRNMHFPTGAILSEIKNNLPNLLHNYGSCQKILNEKMGYFLCCSHDYVQALNGASQIFPLLRYYFHRRAALTPAPSFGEYDRVFPSAKHYSDEIGIDLDQVREQATAADVVVLVNPNNPTGTTISTNWIYEFAKQRPEKSVVVDESFIEFSGERSIVSCLEENPAPNIIVVKSLSKSLGVPGIRLGYVYCQDPNFMTRVRDETPVWNLNSVAEYFLEMLLKHRPELDQSYARTIEDRESFSRLLRGTTTVGQVYPSGANFLLARLSGNRELANATARDLLRSRKTLVKDISHKFASGAGYLRLAVRTPEDHVWLTDGLEAGQTNLVIFDGVSHRAA